MKDPAEYRTLNRYAREVFGKKLYKIALPGGKTCPNRDGTCGTTGCAFCSAGGSGEFTPPPDISVSEQIEKAKYRIRDKLPKNDPCGFIAYFQSFTGTYPGKGKSVDELKSRWIEAAFVSDVEVISIATRPDCLGDDVMEALAEVRKIKPVWIELGLQTMHDDIADKMGRGYKTECFARAVSKLNGCGIDVIAHIIIGLPGETRKMILETARYISEIGVSGVKIQLLHVLEGTRLAEDYRKNTFEVLTMGEYFRIVKDILEILPETIVIHRITGDGPKRLLIAPKWSMDKKNVINKLRKYLENNDDGETDEL